MSLKYAMLGFIDMMPLTGYDLKKMFDSSVKYYWTATHSQIYRTLDEMKKEGLIKEELVHQTDLPNKKLYHITAKGKEQLTKWVKEPTELPPVRHELLVQLSWADRLPNNQIIARLENYKLKIEERLNMYEQENNNKFAHMSRTPRERFLWESILKNGIMSYKAELKWVNDTIKGLKNL